MKVIVDHSLVLQIPDCYKEKTEYDVKYTNIRDFEIYPNIEKELSRTETILVTIVLLHSEDEILTLILKNNVSIDCLNEAGILNLYYSNLCDKIKL